MQTSGGFMPRDRERAFSLVGWAKEQSDVPTMHHQDRREMPWSTLRFAPPTNQGNRRR